MGCPYFKLPICFHACPLKYRPHFLRMRRAFASPPIVCCSYAGDAGDGCYRLEQGLLKVVVSSPKGDERSIAILGPGSIVGELSVLDGLPRSASIIAIRDCLLQFVSRDAFERCTKEHPEIYAT